MAVIIGISGGSGAGKTYLAEYLRKLYGNNLSIISLDSYYKDHSNIPFEDRAKVNYDSPEAYDKETLYKQLELIREGKSINIPIYDFETHTRKEETVPYTPTQIIIIEGILLFEFKEIIPFLDVKIYVDAPSDRRLARRIKRDMVERGRTLDSVLNQYFETVRPMHNLYIEPNKKLADIIYDNDVNEGFNDREIHKIQKLINSKL